MSEDTIFNSAKGKRIITNGFLSSFPNPMRKVIKVEGSHVIVVPGEGKDHRFVFDNVFGPTTAAEEQSYQLILPQILDATFSGKNCTLLSLGGGGNTSWILGKEQLAGQVTAPSAGSPAKPPKPPKPTSSPSLVRIAVSNILTRLSIPGTGFFGLSFACFEIYNDQVIDLLSKKKIDPREHNLPGLTSSFIKSLSEFEDALTLVLLNGKIRNGELRSHIFFRFTFLSSNEAAEINSQPRASPKLSRSKLDTPNGKSAKNTESSSPVLDIVMLAPYNSAAKEFLSSEQNAIKRSLLNLSHLVDKMNGDVTTAGISWRSFKLTQILQPSFSSPSHKIIATAHSYGHKTKLQESLWSFILLDAINKLNDTNPTPSNTTSSLQSPKPTRATTPHKEKPENGSYDMNGSSNNDNNNINKLGKRPETPPQWKPSGPSPPRPLSRESKSNVSNLSSNSLNNINNTSSNKLKHLKLNKKPSFSDMSKLGTDTVYNRPAENGSIVIPEAEGSSLMRDALSKSKLQNAQLLANHAQLASQLETKLRVEKEERIATEESLQKQLKQEREKRERMAKRLQNAQQLLESKEKEVVKLTDIVDKLSSESQAKLGALERVVKARNESYRMKAVEQEAVIKRHNIAFKALQDRVSELMERKVLDMKQNKSLSLSQLSIPSTTSPTPSRPSSAMPPLAPKSSLADKRDSLVLGSGDVLGVISGNDVSRSEDEFELLHQLQKLIAEQVQDLASVNQKVASYDQDKNVVVSVENAVEDFEKRIDQLRYQVTDEFREYLDTVENEDIIAQLTDTIRNLGESFKTKIVVNISGTKDKNNKYSDLVGELDGEQEATEVLRVIGQQLRSTVEDQADSFVSILEDMSKLTDEELSEDLRLPIVWEPMQQDLMDIQERLERDKAESENSKTLDLSSLHQWVHDQRLMFAHQRNLLDQICHKVIQLDADEEGNEAQHEGNEGEEGEEQEEEGEVSDYASDGKEYGDEELNYSNGEGDGYSSAGDEDYSTSGRD